MSSQKTIAFIGLGSNLGASKTVLKQGWELLGKQKGVCLKTLSPPYLSSPVGMTSNYWFTNAVGEMQVDCSPDELLQILLAVEKRLGRVRDDQKQGYQDRVIDLDLIYYDALVTDSPRLTIPHPRRAERLFVLAPLVAIAPGFVDPETGLSVSTIYQNLLDSIARGQAEKQEISIGTWSED
ncbi:MAG: 2-amino-4-hydroxy-6-hydroxymethyldihydropteridine diphosphokinase [Desulfocapsaceae bacterium]